MTTITFYSYKGGVGRSLAVANVARYLQRFGQKVFAIDLDLEAPGLHYKFALGTNGGTGRVDQGVVDFLYTFCTTGKLPVSLSEYAIEVGETASGPGRIWLMPAGNVPSSAYWRRLARISWHDMFYSESASGIPLFLELKHRIEEEFNPDFLLIDSRTGITEVGGVATSVLPDKLVCLVMKNRENLEGAREVLRSINRAPRLPGQTAIEILPVLSRIPELEPDKEEIILKEVRDFLNENAPELSMSLTVDEVFVLHSESDLELVEAIRVGGKKSADQSSLLRDYLRLFSRLVPKEVVGPYVASLALDALMKSLEDPNIAERDLRTIAEYSGHPQAYKELLRFYRLRNAGLNVLKAAENFWKLSDGIHDPVVWEAVKEYFPVESKRRREDWQQREKPPLFDTDAIEGIWSAAGADEEIVGRELARSFESSQQLQKAAGVLWKLLSNTPARGQAVVEYLDLLSRMKDLAAAESFVAATKQEFKGSLQFVTAWARVVLASEDVDKIVQFLDNSGIDRSLLEGLDLRLLAELFSNSGREAGLRKILDSRLANVVKQGPSEKVEELAGYYERFGLSEQFQARLRRAWSNEHVEDFLAKMSRRRR